MWNEDGETLMDEMYYLVNRVAARINKEAAAERSGFSLCTCPGTGVNSPHAQVRGGFERRTADAADHGRTISAGERICHLVGAVGTIKRVARLLR